MKLIFSWFFFAAVLLAVAKFLPGMRIKNFPTALLAAAVYGVLYVIAYRVFYLFTVIPLFLTFGLFAFVINTFLLYLTGKFIADFEIDSLSITAVAAIILTVVNGAFQAIIF
jgi:putative membrane protein